jgi:hypothetical protein
MQPHAVEHPPAATCTFLVGNANLASRSTRFVMLQQSSIAAPSDYKSIPSDRISLHQGDVQSDGRALAVVLQSRTSKCRRIESTS